MSIRNLSYITAGLSLERMGISCTCTYTVYYQEHVKPDIIRFVVDESKTTPVLNCDQFVHNKNVHSKHFGSRLDSRKTCTCTMYVCNSKRYVDYA